MTELTVRQCVVVGSLNPAILTPPWVAENVFSKVERMETTVEVTTGGPRPFAPRFTAQGISWLPTSVRLEVMAESENADPGEFVAKTLECLKHTPVRGVGNNIAFKVEGRTYERLKDLCRFQLESHLVSKEHQWLGFQTVARLSHGDSAALNITFDSGRNPAELRFNFHRDVKVAVPDAVTAARSWRADRAEAERLFDRISKELVN